MLTYEQKVYSKVAVGCVGATGAFLLQWHSVVFYADNFWNGSITLGVINSLFFEFAAIGLWSVRDKMMNVLATLCTLMVLVGPVYEIGMPLIDKLNTTSNNVSMYSEQIELIEDELKQKRETLAMYMEIKRYPEQRNALSERISELTDRLVALKQQNASNASENASNVMQAIIKIVLQLIGVLLTQVVVVLSIRYVSEKVDKRVNKPESWGQSKVTKAKNSAGK